MSRTQHRYTGPTGLVVTVECPWGSHSGNIPPPIIEFFGGGQYVYSGSDDIDDDEDPG